MVPGRRKSRRRRRRRWPPITILLWSRGRASYRRLSLPGNRPRTVTSSWYCNVTAAPPDVLAAVSLFGPGPPRPQQLTLLFRTIVHAYFIESRRAYPQRGRRFFVQKVFTVSRGNWTTRGRQAQWTPGGQWFRSPACVRQRNKR